MIDKTKTNELLKLNWLLKLGFSKKSFKAMYDHFYYKTVDSCGSGVKKLSTQELALLYAYTKACLEALTDRKTFNFNKENPENFFMSNILNKIKHSLTPNEIMNLKQMETKSAEGAAKINTTPVISNETKSSLKLIEEESEEHVQLLEGAASQFQRNIESTSTFGKSENSIAGSSRIIKKRKQEKNEQEPVLLNRKEKVEVKNAAEENENKKTELSPTNTFPNKQRSEEETNSSKVQKQEEIKECSNLSEEAQKFPKKKRKKIEEVLEKIPIQEAPKIQKSQQQEGMIKKKTKEQLKAEEQLESKKIKYNKKNKKCDKSQKEESAKEQKEESPIKPKKKMQVECEQKEKSDKKPCYREKFDSLLDSKQQSIHKGGDSIVNMLIKDSQKEGFVEPEIKVRKGKKGKAIVIEKFSIFDL